MEMEEDNEEKFHFFKFVVGQQQSFSCIDMTSKSKFVVFVFQAKLGVIY